MSLMTYDLHALDTLFDDTDSVRAAAAVTHPNSPLWLRNLFMAVLIDAFRSLRNRSPLIRTDAFEWLTDLRATDMFSLAVITDVLGLNASAIAHRVRTHMMHVPKQWRCNMGHGTHIQQSRRRRTTRHVHGH